MITWHGNNTLNWNDASFGPWPQRVVRKYLLDNATRSLKHLDYIVTISDFLRNELIDRYHINKKKVTKIYWGVDTDIFSPSDMDEEFMLFVGRLVNYKNIAVLIDLAKHLNFKLVCVGNGSDRTNLETYSKQINAPVEFMGRVPLNKLVDIYQKCSFYVTASKWEGFGLPILESGACSKPAIVPNNTAHVEIVRQGETGFIYENDQHLYRIASNLIEHRGLRKEVGAKASERIYKNFNILETAYGYLDIYNRLLNK